MHQSFQLEYDPRFLSLSHIENDRKMILQKIIQIKYKIIV